MQMTHLQQPAKNSLAIIVLTEKGLAYLQDSAYPS